MFLLPTKSGTRRLISTENSRSVFVPISAQGSVSSLTCEIDIQLESYS